MQSGHEHSLLFSVGDIHFWLFQMAHFFICGVILTWTSWVFKAQYDFLLQERHVPFLIMSFVRYIMFFHFEQSKNKQYSN